jgi:hypothetical protein
VKRKPGRGNQPPQTQRQPQSQPGTSKTSQKGSAGQSSIIGLGIPGLLFAQGFALLPFSFRAGIACMSLALVLSWWALFRVFHRGETLKRWAGVIGTAVTFVLILWILYRPPLITVFLFSTPGNYPEGADIYGIKWKPNYSELSVVLVNESDVDFLNLDVLIRTNLSFENGGIAPGVNQCSLGFELPGPKILEATLTPADPKSKAPSIPLLTPSGGSLYRMRCTRFASKSRIDARFAIVADSAQHVEPQWAKLAADYDANFWPKHRFVPQCFKGNCAELTERMRDGR